LKHLLYLALVLFLVTSCKSTSSTTSSSKKTSRLNEQIIDDATDKIGSPYRYGGTTKSGYDCSGLVFSSFQKNDILLPRSSYDMSKKGKVIKKNEARKGDLIFFKTNGKSIINHVGIITEVDDDEIKFVHSSTQLGVIISSTNEAYYRKSFAQINRIVE
jgi:murein DD-endopeptidase / murein LD-carboxypeptidase